MKKNAGWRFLRRRPVFLALALLIGFVLGATQVRGAVLDDGSANDSTADQSLAAGTSVAPSIDDAGTGATAGDDNAVASDVTGAYDQAAPTRQPDNGGGFSGGQGSE